MHKFELFADYFQFILMDEKSDDDFSTIWTEEALAMMFAPAKSAACIGTLRNVTVPVEIEILDSQPSIDFGAWDNIVEASLNIPSGKIAVMGCTDSLSDAHRIEVRPGTYQLLSLAGGIESIKEHWEAANDIYRVYLWPGPERKPNIIKRWQAASA